MLRIDRVKTDVDLVPAASAPAEASPRSDSAGLFSDASARERIKELVLEALREHLRELERRGVV